MVGVGLKTVTGQKPLTEIARKNLKYTERLVVYLVGGMMDGSHGSCDDGFCCERV